MDYVEHLFIQGTVMCLFRGCHAAGGGTEKKDLLMAQQELVQKATDFWATHEREQQRLQHRSRHNMVEVLFSIAPVSNGPCLL